MSNMGSILEEYFFFVILTVAAVFVMVAASAAVRFVTRRFCRDGGQWSWMDALWRSVRWSAHVLIWLSGVYWLTHMWVRTLAAGSGDGSTWADMANRLYAIGIIIAVVLFFLNLLRQVDRLVESRSKQKKGSQLPDHVHAITRVCRIVVIVAALLATVAALGYDISNLLLAGGVSGVVLGFAAKDMLANTFGALTIYLDRPFSVGDTVEVWGKDIVGNVEAITMRLTKIRNFDRQPVYVPNSVFSQGIVINRTRMTHRRIDEYIGVRYQDIKIAVKIADEIRAMLDAHPRIDSGESCIANVSRFGPSSVDIHIYVFALSTEWTEYNAIKQEVLMKASEIISKNGAEFAYPTQTLHIASQVRPGDETG